jgi:hypothetical protein
VHAIAIALSLSLSLAPGPGSTEAQPDAAPESGESGEPDVEPLPDIVPEPTPEPTPEPEKTPEPEPTPEPVVPPAADEQALVESTPIPLPTRRDRLGCDGSTSCRKMSIAGIVVGSLGLISVGAGIGLLVNRDEVVPEQPIFVSTTRPPGLVAVTIGTGVVLTSALMLGAAHKGYKQPDETARVQIGPTGLRF